MFETENQTCWREIGFAGDMSCPRLEELVHCRNCPVFIRAGHGLLDREPPEGYLEESAALLSQGKPSHARAEQSVMVFRLGSEWVGLPTPSLRGVFEERTIRPIPHRTGKLLLGVSVAQGQIYPCISVHGLLGVLPEAGGTKRSLRIFKRFLAAGKKEAETVIFPVDEVQGVVRFNENTLEPPPMTVSRSPAAYIKGILALRDKRVGVLDEELLFSSLDKIIR
ncbi:MAG: chemotaxis protein CheW [Desulfovibrionaceae bacterium]